MGKRLTCASVENGRKTIMMKKRIIVKISNIVLILVVEVDI